jgi:hypothetical protein
MPLRESGFGFTEFMKGERRRSVALAAAVALPVAVAAGLAMDGIYTQSDTTHYLNLAAGRPAMLPFASRQLGPLVVRGLSHLPGVTIERGFLIEGLAALVFFFCTVMFLLVRSGAQRWMIAAIAGMFFWAEQFNALVLPDIFYGALLCGFLLLLRKGWVIAAALMMLPLAVARESTVLTLVCFLLAGWKLLRWREILTAVGSFAGGMLAVKGLAANALANHEHISSALYLFAKMPWNFLKNFLGLNPWANVYPACAVPAWQHAVHLGPLQAVGYCGFEVWLPVRLAGAALAGFGLLPLLVFRVRRVGQWVGGREDLMVRFCLLYGVVSFCLAGALGDRVLRLFEYGWPLFLVALPVGLGRLAVGFRSAALAVAFVGVHLVLTWAVVGLDGWWLLGAGSVGYLAGWGILRRGWMGSASHSPQPRIAVKL